MRFQILIFDGFDELDAIAPYEVLQNAAQAKVEAVVELVTADAPKDIIAAHGLSCAHPANWICSAVQMCSSYLAEAG